jgi:hypothetical protein
MSNASRIVSLPAMSRCAAPSRIASCSATSMWASPSTSTLSSQSAVAKRRARITRSGPSLCRDGVPVSRSVSPASSGSTW